MFTHLFGRLINRIPSHAAKRRHVALNLARLEERCVPAVLMESGAATSLPTWGFQPTPPPISSALNSTFVAVAIGTKDIHHHRLISTGMATPTCCKPATSRNKSVTEPNPTRLFHLTAGDLAKSPSAVQTD